jgi:hypothetical protein
MELGVLSSSQDLAYVTKQSQRNSAHSILRHFLDPLEQSQ